MTRPTGRPRRGKTRPLPRGNSFYTPQASQARSSLERSSARALVVLHQLPVWLVPIVLAGLLVTGLAVPGWPGALGLILVAGFLGGLARRSLRRAAPRPRGRP